MQPGQVSPPLALRNEWDESVDRGYFDQGVF